MRTEQRDVYTCTIMSGASSLAYRHIQLACMTKQGKMSARYSIFFICVLKNPLYIVTIFMRLFKLFVMLTPPPVRNLGEMSYIRI